MLDPARTAERLLAAQVDHYVAELVDGDAGAALADVARQTINGLREVRIGDLADAEEVTASLLDVLGRVGPSPAIDEMVSSIVPILRDLPANGEHRLGDVVAREHVEAIIDELARSEQFRDEVFERVGRSPTMGTIAMRFIGALVGETVQQNRQRVERVPGMKLALGMGDLAARQARGLTPKRLEQAIGGAADKGAQAAMERVIRALGETLDVDLVRLAVMEVWDLHADETVDTVHAYLADEEVDVLATHLHAGALGALATPWGQAVVAAAVEGFFGRYGDATVGEVLDAFGVGDRFVAEEVGRHADRIVSALHGSGHLEAIVRERLEPFYRSDEVLEILRGDH